MDCLLAGPCLEITMLAYIDPNTSQHVFTLFGPLLALLGTVGGLLVSGLLVCRRGIVGWFHRLSRVGRVAVVAGALVLVGGAVVGAVWWLA